MKFLAFFLLAQGCSGLTTTQLSAVIADLRGIIPPTSQRTERMDVLGGMLRLPFHDAFGSGTSPDGCVDPNEKDHNGLEVVRAIVDPVCTQHAAHLSRTDCWALAGNVAIEAAGGDAVKFRFGRTTCADEQLVVDTDLLPLANPDGNPWTHVLDVFNLRGAFSVREIVALMGAHSIGRPSSDPNLNSGFSALPWVAGNLNGATLTSAFYGDITGRPWEKSDDIPGEWLHSPQPGGVSDSLMLNTDMSMVIDTSSCNFGTNGPKTFGGNGGGPGGGGPAAGGAVSNSGNCAFNAEPYAEVQRYAEPANQALWKSEFSAAIQKMEELGYSTWSLGGIITDTRLCEVTDTSEACDTSNSASTTEPSSNSASTAVPSSSSTSTTVPSSNLASTTEPLSQASKVSRAVWGLPSAILLASLCALILV
ncbi:unnamed protein product [Polarella glacialis]|uniref:Plant heme peroxidase family profile domain-containing protein n=1 Tax=Polarella glacialis TaxID=89957 RepID=A0A813F538_POLGL|nr:unnamed protein product [Polarella glacialis]CAE8722203.1 unnamed protein product [Polarella glacialis]